MTHAPDELLAVTLARIETKLDNAISQNVDHEGRLRAVETQISASTDHEARLKTLEARQWPLPAVACAVSVAAVILPFVVK